MCEGDLAVLAVTKLVSDVIVEDSSGVSDVIVNGVSDVIVAGLVTS